MQSDAALAIRKPFYRRFRFWFGLLMAPVIIVGTGWLLLWWDVRSQISELQAQGLPTSAAEWNEYYRLPDGCKDATEEWDNALQLAQREIQVPDKIYQSYYTLHSWKEPWAHEEDSRKFVAEAKESSTHSVRRLRPREPRGGPSIPPNQATGILPRTGSLAISGQRACLRSTDMLPVVEGIGTGSQPASGLFLPRVTPIASHLLSLRRRPSMLAATAQRPG